MYWVISVSGGGSVLEHGSYAKCRLYIERYGWVDDCGECVLLERCPPEWDGIKGLCCSLGLSGRRCDCYASQGQQSM